MITFELPALPNYGIHAGHTVTERFLRALPISPHPCDPSFAGASSDADQVVMDAALRIAFSLERHIHPTGFTDFFVRVSGKHLGGINRRGNPHGLQNSTPPVSGDLVNDRALLYLLFSRFVFPARYSFFSIVVI